MTDEELQALVAQNSQDIAGLKQTVGSLLELAKMQAEETAAIRELAKKTAERSENNEKRFQNLIDEARADRQENRKRFDEGTERFNAMQEVIQSMLLELSSVKVDIDELKAS